MTSDGRDRRVVYLIDESSAPSNLRSLGISTNLLGANCAEVEYDFSQGVLVNLAFNPVFVLEEYRVRGGAVR